MINLTKFLENFKIYLINQGYVETTGTIVSYCNAIKYVCEYLNFEYINKTNSSLLLDFLFKVSNKNTQEYRDMELYLSSQSKLSYLNKGFIKAAEKQFSNFLKSYIFSIEVSSEEIDNVENDDKDDEYQIDIQKSGQITSDFSLEYRKKPEFMNTANGKRVKRNPEIARSVLKKTDYTCEVDSSHNTFISKRTNSKYMEAHHLIPCTVRNNEYFFENHAIKLDIPENIVCLCPTCHRAIHLGNEETKVKILSKVIKSKKHDFTMIGIELELNELMKFYK